jgi:hypothetical protein
MIRYTLRKEIRFTQTLRGAGLFGNSIWSEKFFLNATYSISYDKGHQYINSPSDQ